MKKAGTVHIVAKFILAYVTLAFTLGIVFAYVYYNQFSSASVESIRVQVMEIAEGIATSVDFSGFDTLREEADMTSEVYVRIAKDLDDVKILNERILRIYSLRPFTEDDWVIVVDQSATMSLGMTQDVTCCSDLRRGLIGPSASSQFIERQGSTFITGYSPIYSDNGNVIGVLAVDVVADDYMQLQTLLERNVLVTLVVTLLFAFVFGIAGIYMFLREDKRIRRALEIRNEDLEKSVKQRTESLQEFMAVVVHDLKAPLTAMNWGLQSIEESVRQKAVRQELDQMMEVVGSMRHFVQTILDASKLSLGKMPIRPVKGDFSKIILGTVEQFLASAKIGGLELRTKINKMPQFSFDEEQVKHVLENLVSNAVKYTPKGGVIEVRALRDEARSIVRVEVEDDGVGLSKSDVKKMFAPFMHRERISNKNGSGFGLAIVRGIVEAHGGRVGVSSARGKGSIFWFELPMNEKAIIPKEKVANDDEVNE